MDRPTTTRRDAEAKEWRAVVVGPLNEKTRLGGRVGVGLARRLKRCRPGLETQRQ